MGKRFVHGRSIGPDVAAALGIDDTVVAVREITIRFAANDVVVANVEVLPTEDQLAALGFKFPERPDVAS